MPQRKTFHPISFPSHFQQHLKPNDQAANDPFPLPTLLIAAWHHSRKTAHRCSHPWLSPVWGQGPAAGCDLGITRAGSMLGSSDLGLASPGTVPFANTQLVFIAF